MATYIRNNAWNNGGTFSNPDLLWYAKGVGKMMSRALDAQNSWWFFAAIHGEYVARPSFPGWGHLPAPPKVPTTPVPAPAVKALYWNQCQHQSWYFPPWHRGYLLALEAQIRAAVVSLGGPATWALPYWNYFGPSSQYKMPPAFAQKTLPDGTPNPLFITARYGPKGDGNIYIPIPPVSQGCLSNTIYTGSNAATPRPGFGGPKTGFSHSGSQSGNLESNPHNQVHVDVGGNAPDGRTYGLMSDPGTAALDPIFYLHHSNIDRMWALWNVNGNPNPVDPAWLKGPAASGGRAFAMPMPDGSSYVYTPAQMTSLSLLNYTYEGLPAAKAFAAQGADLALTLRLRKLGAAPAPVSAQAATAATTPAMDTGKNSELVGANDGPLQITSSGARAEVKLDAAVSQKLSSNLATASAASLPDRSYLQLENVRGTRDAHKLTVSVNGHEAGTVALFGLRMASEQDGQHGGSGLTFDLDITDIVDTLHVENALNVAALDVKITPSHAVPDAEPITVGRVSIYRESHR
jgi:tyrosinase